MVIMDQKLKDFILHRHNEIRNECSLSKNATRMIEMVSKFIEYIFCHFFFFENLLILNKFKFAVNKRSTCGACTTIP